MSATTFADNPEWGSDVPPSVPKPPRARILKSFGGFAFTDGGMSHDITDVESELMAVPHVAPYRDPERQ